MEPLSTTVLTALAKAVATQAGKHLGTAATQQLKSRALAEALTQALRRAFKQIQTDHGQSLSRYDVNEGFLTHEAAPELAKVLIPGAGPSAVTLAVKCAESLGGTMDDDTRWQHVNRLRPAFKALIDALTDEVRATPALATLSGRPESATTRIAEHLGAARSTGDDAARYLRWLIDRNRYLRTMGMVRNHAIQLPLSDVFVGLMAQRDRNPGDRAEAWFDHERRKLQALFDADRLDQAAYDGALDRLHLRVGSRAELPAETLPVLDAARDAGHLLVLGDPGSGKTTLLRYLALVHARAWESSTQVNGRPALFPIYLRLGDFARSPQRADGISAFLPGHLRSLECRTPGLADLLETRLSTGRCLILLDGLDEVASIDDRRAVVDAVTNFVTAHGSVGHQFVVTSRISGYLAAPLPATFQAVRLQDMTDETIAGFLASYCPAVERAEAPENSAEAVEAAGRAQADAISAAIGDNAGIRRLAANPLLLTTLVLVHRARGRLPHRRVEAYVEVTEALSRTWRSVQGVPESDLPDERMLTKWLTTLGSWIHEHRPEGSATRYELLTVLGPLWASHQGKPWDPAILSVADPLGTDAGAGVLAFIRKVDEHTGLLVERAPGRYGFPHLTFEEYYAGRALAFGDFAAGDRAGRIRRHLHNPRYDEPILLALGLIARDQPESAERLIAEAIWPAPNHPDPYEDLLGWDFLFALRLLADDIPLETVTIDTIVNQVVDEWLNWENSRCRFLRYRIALSGRIAGLKDTRAAARLFAALETRTATTPRATRFCELMSAAKGIGQAPKILRDYAAGLTSHLDPGLRAAAIRALVDTEGATPRAVAAVIELFENPLTAPDEIGVYASVIRELPPNERIVEAALAFNATPEGEVYQYEILVAFIESGPLTDSVSAAVRDVLRRRLHFFITQAIIDATVSAGILWDETVGALVSLIEQVQSRSIREEMIGRLKGMGALDNEMIQHFVSFARSPLATDTVDMIEALAHCGVTTEAVTEAAVTLLHGSGSYSRTLRVAGFIRAGIRNETVVDIARDLLTDPRLPNRLRALLLDALAESDLLDDRFAAMAESLATEDEPYVTATALLALARTGRLTETLRSRAFELVSASDDRIWRTGIETVKQDKTVMTAVETEAILDASMDKDGLAQFSAVQKLRDAAPSERLWSCLVRLAGIPMSVDGDSVLRVLLDLVNRYSAAREVREGLATSVRNLDAALKPYVGIEDVTRDNVHRALWEVSALVKIDAVAVVG